MFVVCFVLLKVPKFIVFILKQTHCVFCGNIVDDNVNARIGTKGLARNIDIPGYKHRTFIDPVGCGIV